MSKGVWMVDMNNNDWYDYYYKEDLDFTLNIRHGTYIVFKRGDESNEKGFVHDYIPEFPVATQDELTLFELETGYDLTGLIKLLKEKGGLK